jgi:hypothetical protein
MEKEYRIKLVPEEGCDVEGLTNLIEKLIEKEEIKDRLATETYEGKTVAEILDDESLQKEFQVNKGVHIGFYFPVTITKLDLKEFKEGKRDNFKVIIMHTDMC